MIDRLYLDARLAEREVGAHPHPVEAVVAERDAVRLERDRELRAAGRPRPAPDLEDVGRVGRELQLELHLARRLLVVDDLDPLLEQRPREQPVAADPQLLGGDRVLGVDLVLHVPLDPRVRELDRAAVVAAGARLEEDRPGAVDPQDRAREPPRVALVQAEAARVGVDVAEAVGQEVEVALLEDLDGAEVRRLDDRADDRLDEPGRLRT